MHHRRMCKREENGSSLSSGGWTGTPDAVCAARIFRAYPIVRPKPRAVRQENGRVGPRSSTLGGNRRQFAHFSQLFAGARRPTCPLSLPAEAIGPIERLRQASPAKEPPQDALGERQVHAMARRNEQRTTTRRRRSQRRADRLAFEDHRPRLERRHPLDVRLPTKKLLRHSDRRDAGGNSQVRGDAEAARM